MFKEEGGEKWPTLALLGNRTSHLPNDTELPMS